MEVISTIFYFLVTIGILVFIHELGHFIAARMFGMRAEKFYIGFDFFDLRLWRTQRGETEYGIGAFPLGGYVKIAGMVDESMDTNFAASEPQPWEFRSKPVWQRMIVISAGVVMNVLLAVVIFWGIIYHQGKYIRPVTEVGYVVPDSPAEKAGLRLRDKILAINDHAVQEWDMIASQMYAEHMGDDLSIRIERDGNVIDLPVKRADIPDISEERFGIYPAGLIPVVSMVEAGKPASAIGLQAGDTIIAVNGEPVSYGSLPETIRRFPGREIVIAWKRGDDRMESRVTPSVEGRVGIALGAVYNGPVVHVEYSLLEAFPAGVIEVWNSSRLFFTNIAQIIVGKASLSKSVGGPIRIAQMANRSAESGPVSFFGFMALLSMSLALLNIFPFPALDGGHLVFLAYEGIVGKEIPVKVKLAIQQAGVFLLLVFMAFVIYNDIVAF